MQLLPSPLRLMLPLLPPRQTLRLPLLLRLKTLPRSKLIVQ
jgi:hypothetical protein